VEYNFEHIYGGAAGGGKTSFSFEEMKQLARAARRERLEKLFMVYLNGARIVGFVRNYRFDQTRRHVDFAWPGLSVAVEIDGGVFIQGRHSRAMGFSRDCNKLNDLQFSGWIVFKLCTVHFNDGSMGLFIDRLKKLLEGRGNGV
jgi:hypothetical protein